MSKSCSLLNVLFEVAIEEQPVIADTTEIIAMAMNLKYIFFMIVCGANLKYFITVCVWRV